MSSFICDDGGREAAGFKGMTNDCVTRAITIATGTPYQEVYDALFAGIRDLEANGRCKVARRLQRKARGCAGTTPRNRVHKKVYKPYLEGVLGWQWVPTMQVGQGCKVHLRTDELPSGRLVVAVSRHLVAVIDGVVHDLYDCSRDGKRCVYGYWKAGGAK